MKKYRYIEFMDGVLGSLSKTGKLFIVAEKEKLNEYIEEFSLTQYGGGYYTGGDTGESGYPSGRRRRRAYS